MMVFKYSLDDSMRNIANELQVLRVDGIMMNWKSPT